MATNPAYAAEAQRTFLGHPRGLFVLFFAEMWERFSYYGMRALLILYLTKHWLYSDGDASVIYGAYTALVYITPVIGGYLADRYLGQRKAVLFGAVLLTLGHFLMAFEGDGGQGYGLQPVGRPERSAAPGEGQELPLEAHEPDQQQGEEEHGDGGAGDGEGHHRAVEDRATPVGRQGAEQDAEGDGPKQAGEHQLQGGADGRA